MLPGHTGDEQGGPMGQGDSGSAHGVAAKITEEQRARIIALLSRVQSEYWSIIDEFSSEAAELLIRELEAIQAKYRS